MTDKLTPPAGLNLVCGAGGSRSILGTSGALLATHAMKIDNWHTIGGISGGSLPSLMLAAGKPVPEIARLVIEIDFNSMLTPRTHMLGLWWAFFLKECAWKRRTSRGVLTSEKLGVFLDKLIPTWPAKYWTVAVAGDKQLLFTARGVFEYQSGKELRMISDKPAPVGLAVRATCAVPGVIDAVPYLDKYLLDGALAEEGRCPVGVVKEQIGAPSGSIIAIDVGEGAQEALRREHWFFKCLRKFVCGPCCDPDPGTPVDTDGVLLINPDASAVQSLEFKLSPDQKWQAFMAGFIAAVEGFGASGKVDATALSEARSIVASYHNIERSARNPGELAAGAQTLLVGKGLF